LHGSAFYFVGQVVGQIENHPQHLENQRRVTVGAVISELVSARLFPVLRENTGKFVDSSLKRTIIRSVRSANSMAYQRISLSSKTGKIFGLSGNENLNNRENSESIFMRPVAAILAVFVGVFS
jgi:hypothetical protein